MLLESFLELLKHKLRRPPELPKRVLTSAAKAAKHRRAKGQEKARDSVLWIANVTARSVSMATRALLSMRCHK